MKQVGRNTRRLKEKNATSESDVAFNQIKKPKRILYSQFLHKAEHTAGAVGSNHFGNACPGREICNRHRCRPVKIMGGMQHTVDREQAQRIIPFGPKNGEAVARR